MKIANLSLSLITLLLVFQTQIIFAGGIPLTTDDTSLTTAINSNDALLDVLSNDDSGIVNDNFKEVTAVCATGSSDMDCIGNSYTDGIGTVTVNGVGNENNVVFTANTNTSTTFDFKYIMQNSVFSTGSAEATVSLAFIEVNTLSDNGNNDCDETSCTLREAFALAEIDNEPSTINFTRGMEGTITLNSQLVVSSIDLSVNGPGAGKITLSGNNSNRVLLVPAISERFYLSGLTITKGITLDGNSGAGILVDNATETLLENIRITDNNSSGIGGGIFISNAGLLLKNTEISHNIANNMGGGIAIIGGFGNDVNIENTTISNNQSNNFGNGLYVNSLNGQTVNLKFVTSAFNTGSVVDNLIGEDGSIIIESSVFVPGLRMDNNANIVNNSILQNQSGNIFGNNNLAETSDLLLTPLAEYNNTGLHAHNFSPASILYNHVDSLIGDSGCGTQVTVDQVGNPRPNEGACDAGAYEYGYFNLIFADNFE